MPTTTRTSTRAAATVAATFLALAAPAAGQAPLNDGPYRADVFLPYTAENGSPRELQAIAELAGAGPDAGVPRCLGPTSFERTAWYTVPPAEFPQEVTVDAAGRTLDLVDLAAFVQPEASTTRATIEPNACAGAGAGGAEAAEEPTSAVTLHVPARRPVLVQVARRGAPGHPDNERAVLSLDTRPLEPLPTPAGDSAGPETPFARVTRGTLVDLRGATITEEDPAQPACPSLGTVWRKIVPSRTARRVIEVTGPHARTLTVFAGSRPTGRNALDCVNREGFGAMQMNVVGKRRKPLWIRIGTDLPPSGARAGLRIESGDAVVVDGGRGGFDPTTGGPGGGLPSVCARSRPGRARVVGDRIAATAAGLNRRKTVSLRIALRGSTVCDVELELIGPRGHVYARTRAIRLAGRQRVRMRRVRHLRKGVYRLRVRAIDELGDEATVRSAVRGRLK